MKNTTQSKGNGLVWTKPTFTIVPKEIVLKVAIWYDHLLFKPRSVPYDFDDHKR